MCSSGHRPTTSILCLKFLWLIWQNRFLGCCIFVCCKYFVKFAAQSIAFAADSILLSGFSSLWHYLWHFPPQSDRKYNRAVTKAPSSGQCGHFCGITKNDKHSQREREKEETSTWSIELWASACEEVSLSQRIGLLCQLLVLHIITDKQPCLDGCALPYMDSPVHVCLSEEKIFKTIWMFFLTIWSIQRQNLQCGAWLLRLVC